MSASRRSKRVSALADKAAETAAAAESKRKSKGKQRASTSKDADGAAEGSGVSDAERRGGGFGMLSLSQLNALSSEQSAAPTDDDGELPETGDEDEEDEQDELGSSTEWDTDHTSQDETYFPPSLRPPPGSSHSGYHRSQIQSDDDDEDSDEYDEASESDFSFFPNPPKGDIRPTFQMGETEKESPEAVQDPSEQESESEQEQAEQEQQQQQRQQQRQKQQVPESSSEEEVGSPPPPIPPRRRSKWKVIPGAEQILHYSRVVDEHMRETDLLRQPELAYDWSGEASQQSQSDMIPSSSDWTEVEQDLFFHSIARHSRLRPDLIADDINRGIAAGSAGRESKESCEPWPKGKTVAQVMLYIRRLEEACDSAFSAASRLNPLRIIDMPAAREVSENYLEFEERLAARMREAQDSLDAQNVYRQVAAAEKYPIAQDTERLRHQMIDNLFLSLYSKDGPVPESAQGKGRGNPDVFEVSVGKSTLKLRGHILARRDIFQWFRGAQRPDFPRYCRSRKALAFPELRYPAQSATMFCLFADLGRGLLLERDINDGDRWILSNGTGKATRAQVERFHKNLTKYSRLPEIQHMFVPSIQEDVTPAEIVSASDGATKAHQLVQAINACAHAMREASQRGLLAIKERCESAPTINTLRMFFPPDRMQYKRERMTGPKGSKRANDSDSEEEGAEEEEDDEKETGQHARWMNPRQLRVEVMQHIAQGAKQKDFYPLRSDGEMAKVRQFTTLTKITMVKKIEQRIGHAPHGFTIDVLLELDDLIRAFLKEVLTVVVMSSDHTFPEVDEKMIEEALAKVAPELTKEEAPQHLPTHEEHPLLEFFAKASDHWSTETAQGASKSNAHPTQDDAFAGQKVKIPSGANQGPSAAGSEKSKAEEQTEEVYLSDNSSLYEEKDENERLHGAMIDSFIRASASLVSKDQPASTAAAASGRTAPANGSATGMGVQPRNIPPSVPANTDHAVGGIPVLPHPQFALSTILPPELLAASTRYPASLLDAPYEPHAFQRGFREGEADSERRQIPGIPKTFGDPSIRKESVMHRGLELSDAVEDKRAEKELLKEFGLHIRPLKKRRIEVAGTKEGEAPA